MFFFIFLSVLFFLTTEKMSLMDEVDIKTLNLPLAHTLMLLLKLS